jgi:hypothetical protein
MASARYNADSDAVPQRLLMPGVNDPSLWTVRVKVSGISPQGAYFWISRVARSRNQHYRLGVPKSL